MSQPLEKLTLDHWYKVLMAVGFSVFLLTSAGLLPALPLKPALLISIGMFFVGLGEWRNHPLQTGVGLGYIVTGHPRNASASGLLFDAVGLVLLALGFWHLLR